MCAVIVLATAAPPCGAEGPEGVPVTEWLVDVIDATREVGYNVSVATDPVTGDTYISYYEGVDGDLWLARTGVPAGNCGPGNAWECQVVDSNGVVGKFSSIAIGGAGPVASLYISYHDVTNGGLKLLEGYVTRATGDLTYSVGIIDSGDPASGTFVGSRTAITLANDGTPHIGYQVNYDGAAQAVKHAVKVAMGAGNCGWGTGNWQCTAIHLDFDIGEYIDIDVGPGGVARVAFYTANDTNTYPIIATNVYNPGSCNVSDDWGCARIRNEGNDTGMYLAFAMGDDIFNQLAYRNSTMESLEWAKYVGPGLGNCGPVDDSYQCEWIDDIGPGGLPSGVDLATDGDSNPVIVYQDASSGDRDLKIARSVGGLPPGGNCGPLSAFMVHTMLCETLDAGNINHAEAVGGLSIALNANGEAAVAYRELFGIPPDEGRLKVAMEPRSIFLDDFESGDTTEWSSTSP